MTDAVPVADEGTATASAPRRSRSYAVALGSLALAAALLFLASGRTWATVVVADPGLPSITVTITGSELTFGAPLALLALAGIAGLIALGRIGRAVAGAVLVLCAVPAGISVLVFGSSSTNGYGAGDWIANIVGEKTGVPVSPAAAQIAPWWVLELVGVALVLLAGTLAIVASGGWPRLGRRYERDGAAPGRPSGAPAPAAAGSVWDQLDAGVDPTLDPPHGEPVRPEDPNRPT